MNIANVVRSIFFVAFFIFIFQSSDLHAQPAGGKWSACPQLPLLTEPRMIFADSLVGYYIGQDTGYVTTTGGLTWTAMTFPSNARPAPTFLSAPNANTIVSYQKRTFDSNGVVYPGIIESTDQGSTWSTIAATPIPTNVHAFTMWNATDGFRIWEDDISQQEFCAATHDGGKTFTDIRGDATLQKYITQLPKNGVSIKSNWSDSLHGVIAVSSNNTAKALPILLTSDGGNTWSEHYMKYNGDSSISLANAYLFGSKSVWVMPSSIQSKALQGYFLYYSSDFGNTWVMTDTVKSEFLFALVPVSPTSAWVGIIGSNRSPSLTTNVIAYKDISGKWEYVDTVYGPVINKKYIPLTIKDIQFTDPSHGWARAIFVTGTDTSTNYPYANIYRFAVTVPNSVPLNALYSHLRCMPNPATSVIKISGFAEDERVLDVKLSNAIGKECVSSVENIGTEAGLDVRGQPNGCYFVTIRTSQRMESIPVIIMHY
jgi:hypothetical protein